jgi:hypothetical protein
LGEPLPVLLRSKPDVANDAVLILSDINYPWVDLSIFFVDTLAGLFLEKLEDVSISDLGSKLTRKKEAVIEPDTRCAILDPSLT